MLFTLILVTMDKEPEIKERAKQQTQESTEKNEESEGKLGKFGWEPEPTAADVE